MNSSRLATSIRSASLGLVALLAAAVPVQPQSTEVRPKPSGPAKVLVLPAEPSTLAHALSAFSGSMTVEVGESGARSLQALREDPAALRAIREGEWHFVAVVGAQGLGRTLLIEGEERVGDASDLLHHGRFLLEEIREAGARPVLLVPPRRPAAPAVDQQAIDWAYTRLGRAGGAILAPVGDAFVRVRRRRPDLALFGPHGDGWSAAGAHLATAVLAATVTGRPPVASAPGGDEDGGSVGLPLDTVRLLDEEAWAAVRDLAAAGGYRDVPPPPFPAVPILARGEGGGLPALRGTWQGPLRLYPWSASLVLQVSGEPGALEVAGRIRFGGGREDLTFEAADAVLDRGVLSFRNPSDLADGRTLYRLVSGEGGLRGVAELVTDDGSVYAIGAFELRRVTSPPEAPAPGRER